MARGWLPAWLVLLATGGATAADMADTVNLAKLDRSMVREPKYSTASQEYCLVVLGPNAETRVWLVRDGDVLYVDRNGNGDLTEPGEAVRKAAEQYWFPAGDITSRDGKTTYKGLSVNHYSDGYRSNVDVPDKGRQMVGLGGVQKPRFASRAKDAPIIHFDGPLALA